MTTEPAVPSCAMDDRGKPTFTPAELLSSLGRNAAGLPPLLSAYLPRRGLDAALREEVMVAVSRMNRCRHCTAIHSAWASLAGLSDAELAALEDMDPGDFDRSRWLALQYGRCVVAGGETAPLEAELRASFTEREISQIAAVARAIDLGNRLGNTWDAFEDRLLGREPRGSASSLVGELVVLGLVAPAGAPFLLLSKAVRALRAEPTFRD